MTAEREYVVRGIVLRTTKLGESDLVVTLLGEDGSQVRLVAKGARKPQSSSSARLDLCSVVQVSCARGRSLDVARETRLVAANSHVKADIARSWCADPTMELLYRATQEALPHPALYPSTAAFLAALDAADERALPAIAAADLLKAISYLGFRPSFDRCVSCGRTVDVRGADAVAFSVLDGGVVCSNCRVHTNAVAEDANTVAWAQALLLSRFADIAADPPDYTSAFAVLGLVDRLVRTHLGFRLKSLGILFSCGLFA